MSNEQRPPKGPPGAGGGILPDSPSAEPMGATPPGGTPAFDELDANLKDTVPPVGPAPDHASEYVAPRPLPKPVDHQTMENVPIRLAPDIDPRRMKTQKAMHVIKREEAAKMLADMGIAPPTSSVIEVPPEPKKSSKTVTIVLLLLVVGGIAAGAYWYFAKLGGHAATGVPDGAEVSAIPAQAQPATRPVATPAAPNAMPGAPSELAAPAPAAETNAAAADTPAGTNPTTGAADPTPAQGGDSPKSAKPVAKPRVATPRPINE